MTTREALYRLIDDMPDELLGEAEAVLHDMCGAPARWTAETAPYDDEPLTEEEIRDLERAVAEAAAGEVLSDAELDALLGE
jgi:hypothetical protein